MGGRHSLRNLNGSLQSDELCACVPCFHQRELAGLRRCDSADVGRSCEPSGFVIFRIVYHRHFSLVWHG